MQILNKHEMDLKTLRLLKMAYAVLAPQSQTNGDYNYWPGRTTMEGQCLLGELRNIIAADEEDGTEPAGKATQDKYANPENPANPLLQFIPANRR